MAFRIEKAPCAAGLIALLAAPALLAQTEFRLEARHSHWRGSCAGTLRIGETGVAYDGPKDHVFRWPYRDLQQLLIEPGVVRVLTYEDVAWKLGADREFEFLLPGDPPLIQVQAFLQARLDQRFVAGLAEESLKPLWEIPVKLLGRIRGSGGVLLVGEDRIVYRTARKGRSRTWRYADIENISSSGPFQLTITTYERAKSHYGSYKDFNFQLKQALDESRYNDLWRRLNPVTVYAIPKKETQQ